MNTEIKIIIADDHPIFRDGLKAMIGKEPGLIVVAEADDGAMALELIKEHKPDIVVLDLDMPEMNGFSLMKELQNSALPAVSVVVLTMHKDEMHFNQAIDSGARGYIIKDVAAAEVVICIKAVVSGKDYFSPALSSFLLNRSRRVSTLTQRAGINDLTATERRVLYLLSQLRTNKDIAEELGISQRTVENHRAHICSKLELQGAHALTRFAIQHKDELS